MLCVLGHVRLFYESLLIHSINDVNEANEGNEKPAINSSKPSATLLF